MDVILSQANILASLNRTLLSIVSLIASEISPTALYKILSYIFVLWRHLTFVTVIYKNKKLSLQLYYIFYW